MRMSQETLEDGVVKVTLEGPLDIEGAGEIDGPMDLLSGRTERMVIDIGGVDFLASIGIRVLVKSAKTIGSKGGRIAVYNAQEFPDKVLHSSGVDQLIQLVDDEETALASVRR